MRATQQTTRLAIPDAPGGTSEALWRLGYSYLLSRAGLPAGFKIVRDPSSASHATLESLLLEDSMDSPVSATPPAKWPEPELMALLDEHPHAAELTELLFTRKGRMHFRRYDLPRFALGALNRWEERDPSRDEFGRWSHTSSVIAKTERCGKPLVDILARAVGEELRSTLFLPKDTRGVSPWGRDSWSVAVTFDIDSAGHPGGRKLAYLRRVVSERGLGGLADGLRAAFPGASEATAPGAGWRALAKKLADRRIKATFFTQIRRHAAKDDYTLAEEKDLLRSLRELADAGHEIGLHGSFDTPGRADLLASQVEEFTRIFKAAPKLYRNHYLRSAGPGDWRALDEAGIRVDSTIGFSGREGFRVGTCFPYHPLAPGGAKPLRIREAPLHVMDVTLKYHRGLSARDGLAAAKAVLTQARAVGGMAVVLWHPQNFDPILWPGWEDSFWELLDWAKDSGARVDGLGALTDSFADFEKNLFAFDDTND